MDFSNTSDGSSTSSPLSFRFVAGKRRALALLFGISAALIGTGLFDVYQDWILEGNRLWTTLAENFLPLLVAIGIATLGWRWSRREEGEVYATEAARWALAAGLAMGLLCAIVLGFQVGQGRLKPIVILSQITTFGAGAGLIIGYVVARMREARRELRRHHDLLRRTQEVAKVGGWEYDPEADRVEGTAELNRILGLPEEARFDFERGLRFYPPDRRKRIREAVDQCLRLGEPFDLEVPLIRADESRRWARVRGERKRRKDGSVFLTGTLQDITEQKEVEQTLREEQDVLRRMYRTTADRTKPFDVKAEELIDLGRSYLDLPYGHVTRISEDTQEIKYARGGHPMISPGDSCPLSQSYCRKTIRQDSLLAVRDAPEEGWDGDPAYETFGLGAYVGSKIQVGGDIYGTFCFAADKARPEPFSEREKTFVELLTVWASYEIGHRQATRQLEAQNQRLDRFASVVSHDLRNPLNVAKGRLRLATEGLVEAGGPEPPKSESAPGGDGTAPPSGAPLAQVAGHLDSAGRALGRMDEIIEDMLVLTWGRREADPGETEPISLKEAAERCWAHVSAPEATLSVETVGEVVAHEGRLQQLLENLFRNAVEHGGKDVTVAVGLLPEEESPNGFFVEDDGPGIPEEKREKVLETGYSTAEAGTGLGLSIAKAVADSHGWDLSVAEGRNGGARFEITGAEVSPR